MDRSFHSAKRVAGTRGGARLDAARRLPGRLWRLLLSWQERARQRRALRALTPHQLRDIGLTWEEVLAEADKPFWRT